MQLKIGLLHIEAKHTNFQDFCCQWEFDSWLPFGIFVNTNSVILNPANNINNCPKPNLKILHDIQYPWFDKHLFLFTCGTSSCH